MKKVFFYTIVAVIVSVVVIYGLGVLFKDKIDFPEVVRTDQAAAQLEVVKAANQATMQRMSKISKTLFVGIFLVQMVALVVGASVVGNIKEEESRAQLKLKKLENADIFMDLPLYVGLFGTVSSFIIMAFNPQTSRLIAYSSTLIGIIISVILRTIMLFPLKQKLIAEVENSK